MSGSERGDAESLAGRQLRRIRQDRGLTQLDVAVGMEPYGHKWIKSTVNRIEAGKRPLRVNELEDLARMLGVPREMLLTPLPPETPLDLNGQPIDLERVPVEEIRQVIAVREKEVAAAEAVARNEKRKLEELEPQVSASRKEHDLAVGRAVALNRQIAWLRNVLQTRKER